MTDLGQVVHAAINDLIPNDAVVMTIKIPDEGVMSVYRSEGGKRFPPRPAIDVFIRAMNSGLPTIVSDIPEAVVPAANRFGNASRRVRSIVTAPLMSEDTPIGLLTAQCYEPHIFRWEHAEILASIAQSSVGAFERHILLNQISRQTHRDKGLRAVAERLNETLDTEELMSIASDAIFGAVRGALVLVSLVERQSKRVRLRSFRSPDPGFSAPPLDYALVSDSLSVSALESMEQVAVLDSVDCPYPIFRQQPWSDFGSAVITPVAIDAQRAALIILTRVETHGFSDEDLSLQRQFAALLSTAMQNTTAYANRIRHANDLSEVQRVSSTIASQLDLGKSLAEIVDSARTLVDADGCVVGLLDGPELVVVGASGTVAGLIPERVPVEGMLFQQVVETARAMAANDLATEHADFPVTAIPLSVARGWMAVPLVDPEGAAVGVIGVFTTEPRNWDDRDLSLLSTLGASSALAIQNARHFEGTRDLLQASVESLAAAVEAKDPFSRNHSRQVARYARLIAEESGLNPEFVGQIELAALLHDVGKIGIPDSVLEKVESLDPAEWAAIQLHPVIGEQILSGNPVLQPLLPMIRHHHERWDGHGYPDRLKRNEIPVGSTIIAVAEAVDAMTSDQPYHPARPWRAAVDEIRAGRESQFAPDVVDAFLRANADGAFSDDEIRSVSWSPNESEWIGQRGPSLDVRALHIFENVAREIRAGASLDAFLLSVVTMLKDVLDVPHIGLYVKPETDRELSLLVSFPSVPSPAILTESIVAGDGIVAWVARHGILQNIPDVTQDERYLDGGYTGGISSELCVPLLADGNVVGVLNLESNQPAAFSEMDERLLISTADHLANAIHVIQLHDRLKKLSITDALTGLHNHRSFFDHLVSHSERAIEESRRLTIAILDVNDLKAINDNYGHLAGDAALRAVAAILERECRPHDITCRYGGDEFAIILPDTTSDEAWELLNRLDEQLGTGVFDVDGMQLSLPSASWGTATTPDDGRRPTELLNVADERMYLRKRRMSL